MATRSIAAGRLQALIESLEAIVWESDARTLQFRYVSRGAKAILGYPVEQWLADPDFWQHHLHPDDREWVSTVCREATARGEGHDLEYRMVAVDGRAVWLRDRVSVVRNRTGRITTLRGVMVDITDRMRTQEALRRAEQDYRSIFENAVVGIFRRSRHGKYLAANPALALMFGYETPDRMQRECPDLAECMVDPQQRAGLSAALERSDTVNGFEYAVRHRDGHEIWLREHSRAVRNASGRLLYYEGTVQDITDRRHTEEVLRETASKLEAIFRASPDLYFRIDAQCRYLEYHGRDSDQLYAPPSAFIGRTIAEVLPAEVATPIEQAIRRVTETAAPAVVEYSLPLPGGDQTFEVQIVALVPGQVLAIVRNVSARRQAEEALRESIHRLRAVVTGAPVVLWSVDAEGRFTLSEGKGLETLGLAPGALVGRTIQEVYRDHPQILRNFRRALNGETVVEVVEVGDLVFDSRFAPLRGASDAIVGVIGVATDVTDQRRAEEALRESEAMLRQAQKMEAIGRLAGGVAHDFNNLLTAILGCSDLLVRQLEGQESLRSEAKEIFRAAERAATLTGNLLAFSRAQVLELRVLDLNAAVNEVRQLLSHMIEERIRLVVVTDATPRIEADPGQVAQAIMNLAVNARDAMPHGGTLTLRTGLIALEGGNARARAIPPGRYAVLEVTDTGQGMDATTQARIFEPFFTTKGPGIGTGLGLAMVYGFVRQSGGAIDVDSAPGRGATFRILLPAVEEDPTPVAATRIEQNKLDGHETVLVVEDEPVVRALVRETLKRFGYRVLEATEGGEALELADEVGEPIHLVITDMVMPGLSGRDVAEALGRTRPEIRVLYISGYADEELRRGLEGPDRAFLLKPFTSHELAVKVRDLLGPKPRGGT